jgi:hypothetical protein
LNREQILVLRDADFFHRYYTSRIGFCANEFLTCTNRIAPSKVRGAIIVESVKM